MLKLVNVVVVGLVIFGCIGSSESVFESKIVEFLEEVRVRMCYPLFGLPPTDPFQIKHFQIEMNNKYFKEFSGSITNLSLIGLSDFIVNDLVFQILPFQNSKIDITLPLTHLRSLYTAYGSVAGIVELIGDDIINASVEKIRVLLTFRLRTGINLSISNLKIIVNIDELEVDFGTLVEEERINNFIVALINELGIELLGDLWKVEKNLVETTVQKLINSLLSKVTLSYILGILNSEGPVFGENIPGDCKENLKEIEMALNSM